jgi:DnaK suppressor protein
MVKEREMPARKPVPRTGKAKKPATAKPAVRKAAAAPASKPAAKPRPAPRVVAARKTSSPPKVQETKPAVSPPSPKVPRQPAAPTVRPVPTFESAEDSDASDSSLLAGPRNVQPYVVKRGEQYMSKEQLEHFRQILLNWKQDLMLEVDRTVSHMKDEAANFPDPNDRATQEEEFSLELRTRDRERKLIRKIDEALKRIEDGSYGYCLETGEQIGIKRLEARPVATLSIEAQERRERREKQYGDRDDRYR